MSLRPGDAVEHFVIVSSLGEGGMGQVYLARDTRLQRSIALKIMQPEMEGDASGPTSSNGAARLLREAQSAAGLEHPNVVTIYEVGEIKGEGEEAGRPFIAMELVKGKALRAFIGDERVPMKERVRWLVDTARALAAAHKAGLVHRDIKPENVMVRDDGVVKVLDFGLAKRAASGPASVSSSTEAQVLPSLTGKGIAIGTPYYMAPEQMRREPLDGRADQFAWGVVAYELLSGTPAWGRDVDALELVSKLLSEDPAPLAEVRSDVPSHVAAAVARAMSKRKAARFETMDELIGALGDESGALDETIPGSTLKQLGLSPPSGPIAVAPLASNAASEQTPTSQARTGARLKTIGAVLVALAAAAAGVALVRGDRARPAPAPAAPAIGDASPKSCVRNADCGGASFVCGSAGACIARKVNACASNAECVARAGGKGAVCHKEEGTCASLESAECVVVADRAALDDDATLWLGTMFPHTGEAASDFGDDNERGVELAQRDFVQTASGIPLPATGATPRPIGIVSCDDSKEPTAAAHHLVDDARVSAVIGFHQSKEAVDLATSVFLPNHVLVISAPNRSAFLSAVPRPAGEPRLVWRMTPSPAQWAAPLAAFVGVLESELRVARVVDDSTPLRVALLRPNNDAALTLSYALTTKLRFNGKSAAENAELFHDVILDEADEKAFADAARDLVAFAPNVVVYTTAGEARLFEAVEKQWPTSARSRPRYVSVTGFWDDALTFARAVPERRRRIFDVEPPIATVANRQLATHFTEAFKTKTALAETPSTSYDAAYLLMYAAFAVGNAPPSGLRLARAMDRLGPPGTPIDVGPASLFDALAVLRDGRGIDLNGASTRLDFTTAAADPLTDFVVFCVGTEVGTDGRHDSGLRFDATQGALVGTLRCQ